MATNLGDLQKRLNKDPNLNAKFIKDPVGTLRSEGVALDPDMAKELKSLISKAKTTRASDLALRARIRIIIKIGIEF
jgi:hypothetical protein